MKYHSLPPSFFPLLPTLTPSLSTVITVVRFPHRTRDIGSVPLDGHGGVGWEPELTPHNNCLAEAVPPVTQSHSESDGEEKWKGKEHQRSESEDEEKPRRETIFGDPGGRETNIHTQYLFSLGLADCI